MKKSNVTTLRPLATPVDVAEYLGVPVRTLSQWRHQGKGPRFVRVGKHVRYRWADVEAFLNTNTVEDGASA